MVLLVQTGMQTASNPPPSCLPSPFCPHCPRAAPPPSSAAVSGTNKLILCSCIWCQRAPFVRPEPAESGGFVRRRLATAGRKMGTLSGRRLEEGGMRGWQPRPEVISSWGQSGGSGTQICHPNALPGSEGAPGGGLSGEGDVPWSPPRWDPSISEMGVIPSGKSAPCNGVHWGTGCPPLSPFPGPHPPTASRAPPGSPCSNRHHHEGFLQAVRLLCDILPGLLQPRREELETLQRQRWPGGQGGHGRGHEVGGHRPPACRHVAISTLFDSSGRFLKEMPTAMGRSPMPSSPPSSPAMSASRPRVGTSAWP